MDRLQQINEIIEMLRGLYKLGIYPKFDTPQYRVFHETLTTFIYANHLGETEEWETISDNLIFHSAQYMVSQEADKILLCLESVKRTILAAKYDEFWRYIHPTIESVTKDRFENRMYADAVEAAFKEVNVRVKEIVKTRVAKEFDGSALMKSAFSVSNPIIKLGDIQTDTGRSIQQGYMEMFSGAMMGIRNPKAHNNQTIAKEEAIRKLHFASILMYKIDGEIV